MLAVLPQTVSGFTVLPVAYSNSSHHILYVRPHTGPLKSSKGKGKVLPDGRTLFVVNLPPDVTERELVLLFKSCGTIEQVIFNSDSGSMLWQDEQEGSEEEGGAGEDWDMESDGSQDIHPSKKQKVVKDDPPIPKVAPLPFPPLRALRKTGRTAHIVFLDPSSLARALSLPKSSKHQNQAVPQSLSWPNATESPLGLAHYTALYDALRPPLDAVRAHADTSIELHDFELAKKRASESKYKKGEAIVDDDGFTLVTRGGAYGQTVGGGVSVANKKFVADRRGASASGAKRNRKKGEKEKTGFYAFQLHEKKRNDLMELKRKWEEDKAKVEKLKSSRRFRPY
ncbi:hypothetical protein HETIRDRAFT_311712 [Heterobasidion irregulare TC 32-1]|uniref:RRM domain-containing protein n=1 Tax=Heterobasidion irregulare (strain TC 32-1) TaxID=747525 RepID=W4KGN7_HETIT|nr:uncharacterized protein HETIRDRAFT_311712 [Heterobasidion irregulare TC 32-1]ETW84221.1 hypothetical protein HETIRDRAFT_311712 [Heterobasidion irregulare TC 32-1]